MSKITEVIEHVCGHIHPVDLKRLATIAIIYTILGFSAGLALAVSLPRIG